MLNSLPLLWRNNLLRATFGLGLLLCVALVVGCALFKSMAVYTAPKMEKIAEEYKGLAGKNVLVFVWVPPEIKWDYPHIRLDLAAYLGAYLKENVDNVSIVDARRVEDYLAKSRQFESDPTEVGRHFRADVVVHLAVYRFSIRDPGMAEHYRGRIASSVEVHDLTAKSGSAQRVPLREVNVAYPDKRALGYANVRPDQVRQETYEVFTIEVGRKFHSYERPLD